MVPLFRLLQFQKRRGEARIGPVGLALPHDKLSAEERAWLTRYLAALNRISDPAPYGDVTLAPPAMTGRSEAQLARAMAEILLENAPASGAEALRRLRETFPSSPLTVRVAALAAIMRR